MKRSRLVMRLLVAAVLPAVLVAISLATILADRQYQGLDEALRARARAEARQVASAAEFGVFSGSREALQALVRAAQAGDEEIRAVTILDVRGMPLASSGVSVRRTFGIVGWEEEIANYGSVTVVMTPIRRSRLPVDDVYSGTEAPESKGEVDGFVILEMSRARLDAERDRQILIDALVTLAGLVLATALALRIARGVTRPILHIGDVVERIGQGDLAARVQPDPAEVMPSLENGINHMAQRVGLAQEYLMQQIAAATAELRERKDEAERANAAKTRFLAAASHDLRQPLHALGLFASRLAQVPNTPEAQPLVANVNASVAALQDLLDTLLDISRLDAGLIVPKPRDFALNELFARLRLEFADTAANRGLDLRLRGCDVWLHTDPQLLRRILNNFVANALRYTSRGGVLLACRQRAGKVVIEVWDTGIGIEARHLQDIFSEYVQLANPERSREKGLGLGLAICDRLSQLMKLPVGVRSVPGRGSVFRVEVPLGQARTIEPEAPASAARLDGTVVIVEDDADAAAGLAELLRSWGCRAIQAPSAFEALQRCEDGGVVPDIAICDFHLPGDEDGIAAGFALRRRFGPLPVLLLTADVNDKLIVGAARRNFALLTKPARPGKLRALVQQMLAHAKAA